MYVVKFNKRHATGTEIDRRLLACCREMKRPDASDEETDWSAEIPTTHNRRRTCLILNREHITTVGLISEDYDYDGKRDKVTLRRVEKK
uniref:Phage protein n=1 Tax=Heterorhabditis bacteriophora TaxID=37862 RepID=A0A1I7X6V6_HETBA